MKAIAFFPAVFAVVLSVNTAASQDISPQAKPIDPANMDLSVKPCDDFFHYANGNWMKRNPIPPEYSQWGTFNILAEQNNLALKDPRRRRKRRVGS